MPAGFRVHDLNSPVFWKLLMRVGLFSVCELRVFSREVLCDQLFNVTGKVNITQHQGGEVTLICTGSYS